MFFLFYCNGLSVFYQTDTFAYDYISGNQTVAYDVFFAVVQPFDFDFCRCGSSVDDFVDEDLILYFVRSSLRYDDDIVFRVRQDHVSDAAAEKQLLVVGEDAAYRCRAGFGVDDSADGFDTSLSVVYGFVVQT